MNASHSTKRQKKLKHDAQYIQIIMQKHRTQMELINSIALNANQQVVEWTYPIYNNNKTMFSSNDVLTHYLLSSCIASHEQHFWKTWTALGGTFFQ